MINNNINKLILLWNEIKWKLSKTNYKNSQHFIWNYNQKIISIISVIINLDNNIIKEDRINTFIENQIDVFNIIKSELEKNEKYFEKLNISNFSQYYEEKWIIKKWTNLELISLENEILKILW